jgi:hypothetical protein
MARADTSGLTPAFIVPSLVPSFIMEPPYTAVVLVSVVQVSLTPGHRQACVSPNFTSKLLFQLKMSFPDESLSDVGTGAGYYVDVVAARIRGLGRTSGRPVWS